MLLDQDRWKSGLFLAVLDGIPHRSWEEFLDLDCEKSDQDSDFGLGKGSTWQKARGKQTLLHTNMNVC